jgi:transcriptional regulator with XRE-family HTH domain
VSRPSLVAAREAAGLTQRQLAEALGLGSRVRISQYENGAKTPSVDLALRIAAALGTSVEDAFRSDTPDAKAGRGGERGDQSSSSSARKGTR